MDQGNSDLILELDAPNPIPPPLDFDSYSELDAPVNTSAYLPLLNAVRNGDLDAIEKFLNDHPEAVIAKITSRGETALHIATLFEHLDIVRMLVQLMSEKDLLLMDNNQLTALGCAIVNKKAVNAAKCMVEKNRQLAIIPTSNLVHQIPITLALEFGHIEMARYLYSVTPFEALLPENGKHGAVFLNQCFICKIFDIALDLIKHCPRLVMTSLEEENFWVTLAAVPSAFQSEIQLPFWKRWLHNWVHGDHYVSSGSRGIMKIYEPSLAQKQYLELLHVVYNVVHTLEEEESRRTIVPKALRVAVERGNLEFIVEAVKMNLTLLWTLDNRGRSLFHLAVLFRQAKVFNLIHGLTLKHIVNITDEDGNTVLHMAGMLAYPVQLSNTSGELLQMQRELQWFKEVESIMPPMKKDYVNKQGFTARELFTREHRVLVKQGEKWTKGTAGSCSVVAVLVATITFAAAFTVPGGVDQTTGYPIFLHKKLFMLFIISDAASFFSSSTSLLISLELFAYAYEEHEFLKAIPTKLMLGISAMFISIATMIIAFCTALFLMLQNQYSWIYFPVIGLACVPIVFWALLQRRLLIVIYKSTYAPGIFDRNVKPWP